ncbi:MULTISPECIES: SDR family NAD(P)-dependent oxidoreductase [Microbacterium]|uniref:SDR family NAD(P)-dependent oxidoreductase n=1 Tax=Microbacterium TaxID=33882 RepID=UPI00077C589B|nr:MULTISPECIES: SDR family oxidoreductase [Microbacterium]QOC26556.1 SDR family oxidoreductase [Microbacterium hominis]QOC27728.1 SDR family oxidoreductase [Microbacterium hominis]QYF97136.1 SDR family oxidoreductase [Microbacterium sp. PAMC21962]
MQTPTPPVALITGAASGMGQSTVELFRERGYTVVALDVAWPAESAAVDGDVLRIVADVRSREAVAAAVDAVLAPGRGIDVVANIAGVYPPTTLASYDEATYRRIFDINVLGVLNVIAAARPRLSRGASVVNFASVDAFTVSPGQLLYGASKAAVVMLTKALALELAPDGIRVNGIAPGWVATPGNAATGRMEAAAASIPLGRVATPEEIAAWVWLVSQPEYGAFLDGETIVLSGADVMR